jgi:DNA-binding MarR family transcriptional regulator
MQSSRIAFEFYAVANKLLRLLGRGRRHLSLTRERISVMLALDEVGNSSVKELAEREWVAHSTMSRLLSALTASGLTINSIRKVGSKDKRTRVIRLTAKGKRVVEHELRQTIAPLANGIAELPDSDIATLKRAMKIIDRLLFSVAGTPE